MVNDLFRDERLTKLNVMKLAEDVKYEVLNTVIPEEDRKQRNKETEKAWEARFDWVNDEKEKGNSLYKDGKFDEAID